MLHNIFIIHIGFIDIFNKNRAIYYEKYLVVDEHEKKKTIYDQTRKFREVYKEYF